MKNRFAARSDLGPMVHDGPSPHHDHVVQFYDAREALVEKVGAFLAGGLLSGSPAVVIAVEEHRTAFRNRLASMGIRVDEVVSFKQLCFLDARETMESFLVDGMPDERRFRETIGRLVAGTVEIWRPARLHAYGEMVDLLWHDGNADGALCLEELWNDLAHRHGFALHCAYSASHFRHDEQRAGFNAVCAQHGRIVPSDDLSAPTLARA